MQVSVHLVVLLEHLLLLCGLLHQYLYLSLFLIDLFLQVLEDLILFLHFNRVLLQLLILETKLFLIIHLVFLKLVEVLLLSGQLH